MALAAPHRISNIILSLSVSSKYLLISTVNLSLTHGFFSLSKAWCPNFRKHKNNHLRALSKYRFWSLISNLLDWYFWKVGLGIHISQALQGIRMQVGCRIGDSTARVS